MRKQCMKIHVSSAIAQAGKEMPCGIANSSSILRREIEIHAVHGTIMDQTHAPYKPEVAVYKSK